LSYAPAGVAVDEKPYAAERLPDRPTERTTADGLTALYRPTAQGHDNRKTAYSGELGREVKEKRPRLQPLGVPEVSGTHE